MVNRGEIMNKKVVIAGSPRDQSEIDTWVTYFKDQHDVVLDYPNCRAEFWIKHFANQPLDDPRFWRLRTYKKEIPTMYQEHYHHLENANLFLLLNHRQKGYQGYISPIDYADLKYLIGRNLLHDKKTKLYLLHTPSQKLEYYEEINYWFEMGWVELFQRHPIL